MSASSAPGQPSAPGPDTPTKTKPGAGAGTAGVGGAAGVGGTGSDPGPATAVVGQMALRRLGRTEYENTLKSLFGKIPVAIDMPADTVGASTYESPSDVGLVERGRFEQVAEGIAYDATTKVLDLAACKSGAAERACAESFVSTFGRRAWRRPPTADEVAGLLALYDKVKGELKQTHETALRAVLAGLLQAPQFIYHWELGAAKPAVQGGLVKLGGWEVASRLSYLLWSDMPDDALFSAAEGNRLSDAAGIEQEARRMLKDKARTTSLLSRLFGEWAGFAKLPGLSKDKAVIASVPDELKTAMREETERFLAAAVLDDGKWSTVLNSRESFVNEPLAKLYGISGVTGAAFVPKTLPAERGGLFTLSSFLATKALPQESSPIHRGKVIATRLLCRTLSPPPPDLMVEPPAVADNVQTREAYEQLTSPLTCQGCHSTINPPGYAFESFDAIGRHRPMEAGRPVNTASSFKIDGATASFKNASEMMSVIANSDEARTCFVEQWMRVSLQRQTAAGDAASIAAVKAAFASSGFDVRELLVALVKSDSFRLRAPGTNEAIQ